MFEIIAAVAVVIAIAVAAVLHTFIKMDRMVGNDFATGLANMKARAEQ